MKHYSVIAILVLAVLLAGSGCSKPPGQKELERGLREMRRENFVRARALFEKSISVRPGHIDNAMAHNYLGIAAWRLGQVQDAVNAFEDSRRLNPNLIEPVYNLGVLAGERDDLREAARYLNEAATMNREDARPLEYLASLYLDRQQWPSARSALYAALDRNPRSARIYNAIASVSLAMGQPDQALESLMQALEMDTRYAPALFNLAVLYDTRKGDAEQARAFYKKFISAAPSRDERIEPAKAALSRLAESGTIAPPPVPPPEEPAPSAAPEEVAVPPVAESASVVSAPAPAPEAVKPAPAVSATETAVAAKIKLADDKARSGQVQAALDLCVEAAALAGKDKRYDLQEQAFREGVRMAIDQPRAHALLAQNLYERGKYDQAARAFQQAVTLNADYAPAQLGLARLAARANENDAAMIHYRKAVSSDPRLADAQWELAQLYDKQLGLPENAAAAYRTFAQQFPSDSRRAAGLARAETLAPTPKVVEQKPAPVKRREAGALPPDDANARRLEYRPPESRNKPAAIQAFNRASVYQEQREWDRAIYFYLRSLENDDQLVSVFYNLGICYTMKGDNELARDAYRRTLQLDPGMIDAQYNLALLYNEAGDTAAATRLLDDIVKKQPDYASAHYALGAIYSARPETREQAKKHYRRFLELSPDDRSAPAIRQWLDGQ